MDNKPALEFPCTFPIKMMGRDTTAFRNVARTLVEFHTGPVSDNSVKESSSRNGTFVSITVTITADSQRQLDDIYRAASAHQDVLMAL